jgi:hypothetical protein
LTTPRKAPVKIRAAIIGGSVVGGLVLLAAIGNIGSSGDDAKPTTSTLTKTVTVTAQPPTVTATATVTVAAPPASLVELPSPVSEPPVEAMSPLPPFAPFMPPIPSSAFYQNCTAARAAGAAPLHVGEPGYRPSLDGDGDGVACE